MIVCCVGYFCYSHRQKEIVFFLKLTLNCKAFRVACSCLSQVFALAQVFFFVEENPVFVSCDMFRELGEGQLVQSHAVLGSY